MTYPGDSIQVCPKCRKAFDNDPRVVEEVTRCPYCGLDIMEAMEMKARGEWTYEWR